MNTFKGIVVRRICLFLVGIMSCSAYAGDQWEVSSASVSSDGTSSPYTQTICVPKDTIDPAQVLGGLGNCTFDQKNGTPAAMIFTLTCKAAGMPSDLVAMSVTGDASLSGNSFSMNYVITMNVKQGSAGGDFKMSGKAEARKIGQCDAH